MDLDDLNRLTEAYETQVHAIRQRLVRFGLAYWGAMPDYRDAAVEAMIAAIVPRVIAGQLRTAELTRAYLARCADELGWEAALPPVDADEVTGARGVPPEVVYRRPAVDVYTALKRGKPLDQAVSEGATRLEQLIGGDTQLAKIRQARASMGAYPAQGSYYRRVLTGRESCGLCVVASTQRYHKADLLPIHPGCDCNVQPLPVALAESQVIDPERLEQVHAIAEERLGASDRGGRDPDYMRLLRVEHHGEYGPTLTWAEPKQKPKPKAGSGRPPKPPKPPKKPTAPQPEDFGRIERLRRIPVDQWHTTLQYEGGNVEGIPGDFRYPEHGDGRVFIPATSLREPPSEHEVRTALSLAATGAEILFRIDSNERGAKNPDAEMGGRIWEFKAPKGATTRTIENQMRRAGKQAENFVLDLRRSGLADGEAVDTVKRRLKTHPHLRRVMIVDHAGSVIALNK